MWHTTPYILFVFDKISLRITRGDFQTHTALKSVNQKNDIPIKTVLRITAKINSYIQQVFSSIHNSLYNGQGNSSNKKSAAQTQRQGTPLLRDICETAVENINHTSVYNYHICHTALQSSTETAQRPATHLVAT